MNPNDFENSINEIEHEDKNLVANQQVYLNHLVHHSIKSDPTRVEFLMLFGALLESKIKRKIKAELNSNCITYYLEFPTLITRSKPHNIYADDNPFLDNSTEQPAYERILESINNKISESSLGEFVVNCFTYNSHNSIFKMLNDFALVENYFEIHKWSGFDLKNRCIRNFLKRRNDLTHNLLDRESTKKEKEEEMQEFEFIKKNLIKILEQIVLMVPAALKVRRASIDDIASSKDSKEVNAQLHWLEKIVRDYENNYEVKDGEYRIYSKWFSTNHGKFALKHYAKRLKKKLEEGSNV
jgi:hypothetical protein